MELKVKMLESKSEQRPFRCEKCADPFLEGFYFELNRSKDNYYHNWFLCEKCVLEMLNKNIDSSTFEELFNKKAREIHEKNMRDPEYVESHTTRIYNNKTR